MMRNAKVLLVAALLVTAPALFAQQPATANPPMPMPMQPGQSMQMPMQQPGQMQPMDCQAMMQKMQASSKAMDDRLATLVDDMNKAKGSAKVDRVAAVVNEMVTQRKQMRDDMAAMMPQMMNHMMQHMQSGMMSGMQSMANCPMMKGGSQASQPAAPEHKH
jgi:polyhydroxyalkanoate synthesis regulator phasin